MCTAGTAGTAGTAASFSWGEHADIGWGVEPPRRTRRTRRTHSSNKILKKCKVVRNLKLAYGRYGGYGGLFFVGSTRRHRLGPEVEPPRRTRRTHPNSKF